MPHGALDTLVIKQWLKIRSPMAWALVLIAYLSVSAVVVLVWWIAPGLSLAIFLVLSMVHFSGDLEIGASTAAKILYGGAIILCPFALHSTEVTELFALIADKPAADYIAVWLYWGIWPWIAAIALVGLFEFNRNPAGSFELHSITALLILTPPLVGFTLFFCGMHSARHMRRVREYTNATSVTQLARYALGPMLATAILVAIAAVWFERTSLDARLARLVFIGLSALTVPHMIVVEQMRFSRWKLRRNQLQKQH